MTNRSTAQQTWLQRWLEIEQAGGVDAYIDKELSAKGFLVQRREVDKMSARELKAYKESLKKEAEAKKTLKQESWQAYRVSHLVWLGEGIYWRDQASVDPYDLPDAEERRAANELPLIDTPKQLAEALSLSISELRWLSFHREAATYLHYTPFEIPKRTGGMRRIWAPRPKLKQAQRWILDNILMQLPVHGAAHGFLPERSILSHAKVHVNPRRLMRLDIQDFFPTVTFVRVKGLFRKAGYREQIATLLALLCTEAQREIRELKGQTYYVALGERCLPQGAPTSPMISNLVSLHLDRRLQGLARSQGWRYSRYADDLTFSLPDTAPDQGQSTPAKIGSLQGAIKQIVREEGFALNDKKTWVARKGGRQAVTGLIVNGEGQPRVPRELKRRLRATLHNLSQGKTLHEGENIRQVLGYSAFVAMVEPELGMNFLRQLAPHLESMFEQPEEVTVTEV